MAPFNSKKRKLEDGMRGKISRPKKFHKQTEYHSSSEDSDEEPQAGFDPVNLAEESEDESTSVTKKAESTATDNSSSAEENSEEEGEAESSQDELDDDDLYSLAESSRSRPVNKRNDPNAFSTSISKILNTKLSQSARQDPLLSRSKEAVQTSQGVADEKLEARAKAKIRAEKKEALDRGRVRDVLGLSSGEAGETAEEEKRLRKIAQKGVIKLFNAVRAAQVKGEEAAREQRRKGTVGLDNREETVNEMSKKGFLDLINGKKGKPIEEA
ncbi:putative rrna processing protein rrp15 [Phaeomoniella chlamydospora]|uniref:Putative rrna processing protein rrp15 n=1 Tax=Phaeomoniella chlamydospora TaxID=158046 RepID=A0A0G2EN14_PHACM|nr:putative rrna processing protein rrp15 [Phaeomoniella chlamydospora]